MTTTLRPDNAAAGIVPVPARPTVAATPATRGAAGRWPAFLFALAVGGWLGVMLFFAGIVTPQVFGVLGSAGGGPVVAAMFPRYYLFGVVCSLAGAAALAVVARRRGEAPSRLAFACLLLGAGLALVSWLVVEPMVAAAQGGWRGTLHMLSIALNGVMLVLTAIALWAGSRAE